jgi:hypothetical protein
LFLVFQHGQQHLKYSIVQRNKHNHQQKAKKSHHA